MNSQTVTVPAWVVQTLHWVNHNWTVVVGVFVVAVLGITFVEVVKRKYNAKQEEAMAKRVIAWLLLVSTTFFSWLAYALFYTQGHQTFLQTLPVIGSHVTESLGVGYTLYNLRLNKWYEAFANWASKETAQAPVSPAVEPQQPAVSPDESAANFQ